MSVHRNAIKAKITLRQEWLDTLDRDEFLRLFINLKPRGLHGNFKSQVWNYFGALCRRNVTSDESAVDSVVLDDNFNYCRLCLAKQQHMLRLEKQDWTCMQNLPVIRGLANSIKCYRTNTATGALSDHLLHDHGLEYSKKHGSDLLVANTSPNENGYKLLKSGSFPINQDILLLQEVLAHNPFSSSPADVNKVWEKIARSVSATDEDFMLDGFRCHKRTNLLMDWFKQDDNASLQSVAATEHQHREREQLLQRLVDMENDGMMPPVTKRLKVENDEGNGFDGWDMSIDTSFNNSLDDIHGTGASAESSDDTIIISGLKPKKHDRLYSSKKRDFVSHSLAKKELKMREKELALKREQLELQKQQLQFDRDRFAAEQQERALRYQTEKEEREARLQLESEERRTLMEILKNALIKQ